MRIMSINLSGDPACVGASLCDAIKKYSSHTARHVSDVALNRMSNHKDLVSEPYQFDEIRELIHSSDILHFNQSDWRHESFKPYDGCIRATHKIVYHGHGGSWLLDPAKQIARCKDAGASMVVCSPMDSAVVGENNCTWVPNIMPLDEYREPDWGRDFDSDIIIGLAANHSSGTYKGVEMARYMVGHLGHLEHGYPVVFEAVLDLMLNESLSLRKQHHMTIDNWVQGFSGMAGFEGLALGQVVFARFDPVVSEAWRAFSDEMIPIVDIKGFDTCAAEIRKYCNDRELLQEDSRRGRAWIEKYYNEKAILEKWIEFYEGL